MVAAQLLNCHANRRQALNKSGCAANQTRRQLPRRTRARHRARKGSTDLATLKNQKPHQTRAEARGSSQQIQSAYERKDEARGIQSVKTMTFGQTNTQDVLYT